MENNKKNDARPRGYNMETSEGFNADGMLNPSSKRHMRRSAAKNSIISGDNEDKERKNKKI